MQIRSALNVTGLRVGKYHFVNLLRGFCGRNILATLRNIAIISYDQPSHLNPDFSSYSTRCGGTRKPGKIYRFGGYNIIKTHCLPSQMTC